MFDSFIRVHICGHDSTARQAGLELVGRLSDGLNVTDKIGYWQGQAEPVHVAEFWFDSASNDGAELVLRVVRFARHWRVYASQDAVAVELQVGAAWSAYLIPDESGQVIGHLAKARAALFEFGGIAGIEGVDFPPEREHGPNWSEYSDHHYQ